MAQCEVCGNDYDKTFDVTRDGETQTFDSFECAIHAMAPTCGHCGTRMIGHGIESGGSPLHRGTSYQVHTFVSVGPKRFAKRARERICIT